MSSTKQTAFTKAYEACHEPFVRYCSALAYGKMDTQDLVQEVLLSTFKNFEKIENKDLLLHYMIRAARNTSINHWKKSKKHLDDIENHRNKLVSKEPSPENYFEIESLYHILDQLPEHQKNAIVLFEINGFSMKEIAEIQNSSVSAVKTKVSRGRSRLRELMKEHNKIKSQTSPS